MRWVVSIETFLCFKWIVDNTQRVQRGQRGGEPPSALRKRSLEPCRSASRMPRRLDSIAGVPLRQPTVVRILYDDETIYFGFTCFDDDPAAVVRRTLRRDADQRTDDRITVMLDTFDERRTGYLFQVNPNGARWDALLEDGGNVNIQWDAIWYAAARMRDNGWVVELAIPMKSLNFPEEGTGVWGLNLARAVARQNQTARWAYPLQNVFLFDAAHFGNLDGMEGLEQGIGLDAVPAYTIRQKRDTGEGNVSNQGQASLDVFYKITPELTNVLTTNTDFTEAQPDRRRANLTRFPLFFPEQRDFFLQDAGIFHGHRAEQPPAENHPGVAVCRNGRWQSRRRDRVASGQPRQALQGETR